MPDEPKGLHAKIAEVQNEIGVMPKDRHVDVRKDNAVLYSYDYLSESALMSAVREKLAQRGVAVYVSVDAQRREGQLTMVETSMTFADGGTGDTFTVRGQGQGADASDKGVYKATTGAVRYMLWKTFLVPTEGDDPNQPHDVDADRADAKKTIGDVIGELDRYCEDGRPWIKEAVEGYYSEVETLGNFRDLPPRVREDTLVRLDKVCAELAADRIDPADVVEGEAQALLRRAFAKAFDGLALQGPDPFRPRIPF